jgi:hypothetical protein
MSVSKRVIAAVAMLAAVLGVSSAIAAPASAGTVTRTVQAASSDSSVSEFARLSAAPVWYIHSFWPAQFLCEAQRRWGISQRWWTADGSACATNGSDWALFIRREGTSGAATPRASR